MLRPTKKISKRELKQDALVTTYVKATTFYEQNKRSISIGITVLVVAVIAVVVFVRNRNENNERAMTQLSEIHQYYDNGQYQTAIDGMPERNIAGLKSIVDNYGNTAAGDLARFYLADAEFQLGKYDDALRDFQEFGSSYSLLAESRLTGIGGCYEAKGMYREAAESYEKAAAENPKGVNAAQDLNNAARNYAQAGEREKAIDLYKRLKKNYPTTTFARDADLFIARLSV